MIRFTKVVMVLCLFFCSSRVLADTWTWVDEGVTNFHEIGSSAFMGASFSFGANFTDMKAEAVGGTLYPGISGFGFVSIEYDHNFVLYHNGSPASTNPGILVTITLHGLAYVQGIYPGTGDASVIVTTTTTGASAGSASISGIGLFPGPGGNDVVGLCQSNSLVSVHFHIKLTVDATGSATADASVASDMKVD